MSKPSLNVLLQDGFSGDVHTNETMRILYATDASVYREIPLGVVFPKSHEDIGKLVKWASESNTPLIPRAAGTSLAGQVVGSGLVVDVSKYLNRIIHLDKEKKQVKVEPGVVRDELNVFLKPHGLFFAPITSTASRANIGGMIGNNSCGSNSIIYGSVREHLISVSGYLADGSFVTFGPMDVWEWQQLTEGDQENKSFSRKIHSGLKEILVPENRELINKNYPTQEVKRRNTGYALDYLANTEVFKAGGKQPYNVAGLIAGSEGTLMFVTEAVLNLEHLPPPHQAVICVHCNSINESLHINNLAIGHHPDASELIDKFILECAKTNITQKKNRSFIIGDPAALLAVEFRSNSKDTLEKKIAIFITALKKKYDVPVAILRDEECKKIWDLRAAGLGVLSTKPGDSKPYAVVEDAAVNPYKLPEFINGFDKEMDALGLERVYYAHAGSGELHLRPIFNLKTNQGKNLFRKAAESMVLLVKNYQGSLSGEHGDGRLRGEFIPQMLGEDVYALLVRVKELFDPQGIFNPGKIINTPPMDECLRYTPEQIVPELNTMFDFGYEQGIVRAAEMCSGSAECRKGVETGGTMCPSYMATKNEKETTRSRANILREVLTAKTKILGGNAKTSLYFDNEQIKEVMSFCLSCKGCKSECPSNVDVAKLKAEFQYQYFKSNSIPLSTRMISSLPRMWNILSLIPGGRALYNGAIGITFFKNILYGILEFAKERPLPQIAPITLRKWYMSWKKPIVNTPPQRKQIYFFADEFTNHQEVEVGKAAIELLVRLGYEVIIPEHVESGRTAISKGNLDLARAVTKKNLHLLSSYVSSDTPLVGVEPSSVLTFRDEAISLLRGEEQREMKKLSKHIFLLEEFLAYEIDRGAITNSMFSDAPIHMILHGHCHQKSLSDMEFSKKVLCLPKNHTVEFIPSGCCGMAGSFGYEEKNFELSKRIGELALFPFIRKASSDCLVVASGVSCREQISFGTNRKALHPAEVLLKALK